MIVQSRENPRNYSFHSVKLKRVKFIGFQSPNRTAEVHFSDDASSVIYGDNGCGKTTFLKLLHGILNQDSSILQKDDVISAHIDYTIDDGPIISAVVKRIEIAGEADSESSQL